MIYIVEDDSNIAEIESYSLRNSGFDVEVFSKGNELIEAMHNSNPQLIILDYLLEDENGAQILERIRAHKKYEDIPVIFVTCKGGEMDKVKVLDAGADDFIAEDDAFAGNVHRLIDQAWSYTKPYGDYKNIYEFEDEYH